MSVCGIMGELKMGEVLGEKLLFERACWLTLVAAVVVGYQL